MTVLLAVSIVSYVAAWTIEMVLARTRYPYAHRTRVWRHIANAISAVLGIALFLADRPLLALGVLVGTVVVVLYTEHEYRDGPEVPES